MKTQLLIENLSPNEANMIVESWGPTKVTEDSKIDTAVRKSMWLSGTLMQAELKNRNGRIYPLNEMINAVAQLNEQIKAGGGVVGECDHPESLSINYKNASHVIKELRMEGNNAVGKIELLDEGYGLICQEIYRKGIRPAVSSRGAGNVGESGIVEGFNLITIDIVATNSAPGANPKTVYESLQFKKCLTLAESVKHDPAAQKYFQKEIIKLVRDVILKK